MRFGKGALAHHNFKSVGRFEKLEPRYTLSTTPLITEFMASNDSTLFDGDGNASDWIELYNPTAESIDLTGWHLTDRSNDLDKWTFPNVAQSVIGPGEFLVVFASGQDDDAYIDPGGALHTNFALNAGGEYLALSDPSSAIVHEFTPEYPEQTEDYSYGIEMASYDQTFVDRDSPMSYWVPTHGDLGTTWTEPLFDNSTWDTGTSGIGYENSPGSLVDYSSLIDTTIPSGTTSVYTRFEFNLADPSTLNSLTLRMLFDDGFAAYLNGELIAEQFAPNVLQWNSVATGQRGDSVVVEDFVDFDISSYLPQLVAGDNVLSIQGLNLSNSSDMVMMAELVGGVSGEIGDSVKVGYFDNPTPGFANGQAFDGFVEDTKFSHDRGFYNSPFNLQITSATTDATIVYTTDGSTPMVDENMNILNGIEYTGAVNISATSVIRAAAFKLGFEPTNADTQTYLFLSDVVAQSPTGSAPSGFPSGSVNGQVFDYGMDPNIVNSATWGPQLQDALSDIPSISLVTDSDNLFDSSSGIYVNAEGRGRAWERPTSIELINGDGTTGFQTDAGLRIRGGFSRGDFNPKHSFRLFFRSEYGDGKLNFPLFGEEGADEFDAFDLRTAQNYAWSNDTFNNENHNTFLRDIFSRDLQGEMGQAYTRGDYYHLYINGVYWGLYQTEERPEADFASTYYGGTDEDWDAVKASGAVIEATDGNLDAWNTLSTLVNAGFETDEAYYSIQGLNTDGTENPALEKHIDVDNLIDFMISVNYTANRDMPLTLGNNAPNNFWTIRPQDGSQGWMWIAHDSEHSMGAQDHNVYYNGTNDISVGTSPSNLNPRYIHQQLTEHEEYRVRFADRVQQLFFNDGPLTIDNAQAMLDARAAQIDMAIIAESARWGDQHNEPAKTKDTWLAEVDWLRNTFLLQRGNIVLQQFRSQGWLPDTNHDAPSFSQFGGILSAEETLSISNSEASGTIYYTLDGSDPRLPGGGVNENAQEYVRSLSLASNSTVTARLYRDGEWSAMIQADFTLADAPADNTNLRVTEIHYNPVGPTSTELALGFEDGDQFEFIELQNISNETISLDGVRFVQTPVGNSLEGISFEFGLQTLQPGEYAVLVKNLAAFQQRYGTSIPIAGTFDGNLSNGGETLTLRDAQGGTIQSFAYQDGNDPGEEAWPTAADGDGPSLVVLDTAGDYSDGANWMASSTADGSPGSDGTTPQLAGDYNSDNVVDLDDYHVWKSSFGQSVTIGTGADGNADGIVNLGDYTIWRDNLGASLPVAAVVAPSDSASTTTTTNSTAPTTSTATVESSSSSSSETASPAITAKTATAAVEQPTNASAISDSSAATDSALVDWSDQPQRPPVAFWAQRTRALREVERRPVVDDSAKANFRSAKQVFDDAIYQLATDQAESHRPTRRTSESPLDQSTPIEPTLDAKDQAFEISS
ncbi:lamin tail domain-containing protein [Aeoliella mucimassa]|uniref:CotH protein n=1 Tax=Aeoliella mucimassa TaxID=2527972 RepID=A0A518AQI3_9BACT|nr:lamin tail domain-containing protein [Aeoliella mucimassa]QDU56982.1 CotH protein [Aeoliella mucimassa]